jgi:hypothetical protein
VIAKKFQLLKKDSKFSINPPLIIPHFVTRRTEMLFNKFRANFTALSDDCSRHGFDVLPFCTCGSRENYFHFFYECINYSALRTDLLNDLTPLINTPLDNVKRNKDAAVNLLLFGGNLLLNSKNPQTVFDITSNFIIKSKRFV